MLKINRRKIKTRIIERLAFFILLLPLFVMYFDSNSYSQEIYPIDSLELERVITGNWDYLDGVDSNWQEIDDRSGWRKSVSMFDPDTMLERTSGFAWFSRSLSVSKSLRGQIGAFILLTKSGAAEVFLNGKLIRKYGVPSIDPLKEKAELPLPREFFVFQFDSSEFQRVDVRISSHTKKGPFGFRLITTPPDVASMSIRQTSLTFGGIPSLVIGSFLGFSLIHLLLFFFYKEDRSNLFYGMSTVALSLMFLLYLISRFIDDPAQVELCFSFMKIIGFLAVYLILRVFYDLFYPKVPRWHWAFLFGVLIAGLSFWFDSALSGIIGLLYMLLASVEFIRIIVQTIRHRKPGGKNLGIGVISMFIGMIVLFSTIAIMNRYNFFIDEFGNQPSNFVMAIIGIVYFVSALMMLYSVPLSMSLFISRKSAETNESLKLQLVKVEELSAETLRQEREKQRILEGQKEMLEREVKKQTKELRVQHEQLKVEKHRSEELLLNILPEEIAEELKEKGSAEAVHIDQVTVLFTDFKGFTAMSEQLSPKELVHDLHECFSLFDKISESYGIEKIKTIGDAYMAAGGLPTPNRTHAQDVVNAALEMAEVVEQGKAKKIAAGLPFFEVRIGIHTGPVVAGIVGVKKFSYDIWGDTVNTASRMESSGAVGRVNISEATFELLKDDTEFTFESRGKIKAKGKGEMEMYFVSRS